jgi:Zn-dependent protease
MDLSPVEIRWIIQGLIILILSIAVHEFGHAIVADRLGDRLPRSQGRVTLNPIAHADPIGTLLMPVMALIFTKGTSFGFGWGRPVMVNPAAFSRRFRMRTGHMMVAAAGPAMNVVLGVVLGLVHVILIETGTLEPGLFMRSGYFPALGDNLSDALAYATILNFILAFFNLIPAPPLDGGAVLEGFLPDKALDTWRQFAVYGPFVIMAVIFIPGASLIFVRPALWLNAHYHDLLQGLIG